MNKQVRRDIQHINIKIGALVDELQDICNAEEEKFDNMPESLQGSEKGEAMQEAIDILDSAISSLEDVVSELEELE